MTGNIVDRFSQLSDKVQEVEKSVKKLGPEFKNLAGTGMGSNPKLHSIVSGTDFKGGFDGILKSIAKNKIKAYDGGILGKKELAGILDTRNALKSAQLGAKASGYKDIEKMLKAPLERYETLLKAMDVSLTRGIKAMDLNDGDLKNTEKAIKKFVDDANKLILTTENSFNGMGKTAAGAFKKANPSKTAAGTKIRGKDFSYDYDRYQSDPKYAKQVDELKLYYKRKADNYGQIGESAMQNAAFRGQKVFGSQSGQFSGFFQEIVQGFKNGINDGLKDFDIGELLSNTIKKGGKSRRQNKVLDKFGYDSEFILDTQAAMKTKSFQQFAKQQREKFGDLGKQMTDRDIMRGATKKDRANLLKQIKGNKEIDFSQLTKGDKSKVFAGLVNNKGATSMMGGLKLGGVFLTAAAGVGKLAEVAGKLGTEALKAYEGVQQLQTQLGVVFGSTVQSDKMFSQIEGYAKKSPFGVENMTQQAILLKQSGVYASELMDTMKRIGDISSGNNEKMKSISEVYARVMSSQRVTARDMRQLSTAGVPSYSALADAMGVERGLVRGKLQRGEVSAVDFQKMIERLTDKGGMFYGATEKGAQTFAARKQNLADAKQMAFASVGDLITRLGSPTGQARDGWYAGVLGWLEGIYNGIEEVAANTAKEKDVEAPDKILEEIKKREDILRDPTNSADVNAGTIGGQIKLMNEIEDLKKQLPAAYAKAFSSGSDLYEREKRKGGSVYNLFQQGTGANFEVKDKWGQIDEEATKKKIKEQYEYYKRQSDYHYFAKADVGTPGYFTDLYENYAKHSGVTRLDQNKVSKLQAAGFGDESAGLGLEDIIKSFEESIHPAKYAVEYYFSSLIQATQEGADDLNHQIENVKDTFTKSGEVNFGKTGLEGYGAQHLMTAARDDYQNNSPVYQMSWKDQKAYWDDQAKKEIELYSSKTKKGKDENGNDIYDMSGLTAEEMQRAMELLMTSHEDIGILAHPDQEIVNDQISEKGMQDIDEFRKNLEELASVAENTGGKKVFGPFMDNLEALQKLLGPEFGKEAKKNLEDLSVLFNKGLIGSLDAQLNSDTVPAEVKAKILAMKKNTQAATQTKTYNDDTSYINRRKQASLRAHVLSNVTGVSAERVANSKESSVMNAYLNNFSQRQTFAQLGKVLMQNGAELKDVARAMQEGKNGQKYGMYDWNKSTSSIEEQAAQKNVATQEALISAYQQQIDALQELTVGSIATRDQWDNLGSLSAQLGVAFELSAKTLADGTVQFTDATIQSAHKMMEELNLNKFVRQMDLIMNRAADREKDERRNATVENKILKGEISGVGYVKGNQVGKFANPITEQIKEQINKDTTTLAADFAKNTKFTGEDAKKDAEKTAKALQKFAEATGKPFDVKVVEDKTADKLRSSGPDVRAIQATASAKMWADYNKIEGKEGVTKPSFQAWGKQSIRLYGEDQSRWAKYFDDAARQNGLRGNITTWADWNANTKNYELKRLNGQNVSNYKAPVEPETKGAKSYKLAYDVAQLKPLLDLYKEKAAAGELPEGSEEIISILGNLINSMGALTIAVDGNTRAQEENSALKETRDLNNKLLDYLGSHGVLGEDTKDRLSKLAFSDMEASNPMLNGINTPFQEMLLELRGMDRNVNYSEYRDRLVKDMLKGDRAEFNEKGERTKNAKIDLQEEFTEGIKDYLTSSGPGRRDSKKLYKALNTDEGREMLKNSEVITEEQRSKLMDNGFKGFADELKELDTTKLNEILSIFDNIKGDVDDIGKNFQEVTEQEESAEAKLKGLRNVIQDEIKEGAIKAMNTGFSKAGDLAYKLQNNLIEGADATMEMKKALAGVGAEMLSNIGSTMTDTGLKIAGGAAVKGSWGLVAAGLALAAAGGAASFGGGMLSAFASDNNKGDSSEAEDQLARLEDLKDNLAELLKQAKDDAIYYETNLRQKQAVAFNDAVSSTSVNDAIITPNGVVNTAPDDYIMAMKDPTQLMGKGGGGTNVSFSIVNESGTPMTVTGSETRQNGDTTEITAIVNAIVQKSMNDGEYDDVMAGMQVRQRGSQISS